MANKKIQRKEIKVSKPLILNKILKLKPSVNGGLAGVGGVRIRDLAFTARGQQSIASPNRNHW